MLPESRDWMAGLWHFAAHHRIGKPLLVAASEAEQAAERRILHAWLERWLATREDAWAARRPQSTGGDEPSLAEDPDPGLVLTTSAVGAVAAAERFLADGLTPDRALAVTELEYRLWCIRNPDDDRRWHVNVWNWIKTRVPEERHAEFASHPLGPGEAYWLHRAGQAGCGDSDRRECHLWRWNGHEETLLEAFVTERGVGELS